MGRGEKGGTRGGKKEKKKGGGLFFPVADVADFAPHELMLFLQKLDFLFLCAHFVLEVLDLALVVLALLLQGDESVFE